MNKNEKKSNLNSGRKIEVENKEKTIIYQYYSLDTFDSVIKHKELWFSDIKKMNDMNEDNEIFIFLRNELQNTLNKIDEEEKKIDDCKIRNEFLKEIKEEIMNKEKKYNKHYEEIKKYSLHKNNSKLNSLKKKRNRIGALLLIKSFQKGYKFISCFSEEEDLLGQWRTYADDGRGVAVGYDLEELENILKSKLSTNNGDTETKVISKKIKYLNKDEIKIEEIFKLYDDEKLKELDDFVEELLSDVEFKDEFEKRMGNALVVNLFYNNFFKWIVSFSKNFTKDDISIIKYMKERYRDKEEVSTFFKHCGFKEEKEFRILLKKEKNEEKNEEENKEENSYITESQFRISHKKNDIIEYIKLVMTDKDFKKVLSEVIIGPNNSINENDMKNFLLKYKLLESIQDKKIRVKKSTIPYRT
mgnify:CR=1 FL=1